MSGKQGRDTQGDRGRESVTQTVVSCFRAPLACLLGGIFVNDVNNKCKWIVLFGTTAMSHCCSWLLKQAGDDSWSNISLPRSQPHLQLVCVCGWKAKPHRKSSLHTFGQGLSLTEIKSLALLQQQQLTFQNRDCIILMAYLILCNLFSAQYFFLAPVKLDIYLVGLVG